MNNTTNGKDNSDTSKVQLKKLEGNILEIVETLRQLSIMIENYQSGPETEQNWFYQLSNLVSLYQKSGALGGYESVMLPRQALQCADVEQSPDLFLKETHRITEEKKQLNKGRTEIISQLQASLEEELRKQFPDEFNSIFSNITSQEHKF